MRRTSRLLLLAACAASSLACDPGEPVDISGTWTGTASDSRGSMTVRWLVTQEGSNFIGTATLSQGAATTNGSLTGSVAGQALSFSVIVPGSRCTVTFGGSGRVEGSRIDGRYAGTDTCTGTPITNGIINLSRQ